MRDELSSSVRLVNLAPRIFVVYCNYRLLSLRGWFGLRPGIAREAYWTKENLGPDTDPNSWLISDDNVLYMFRRYLRFGTSNYVNCLVLLLSMMCHGTDQSARLGAHGDTWSEEERESRVSLVPDDGVFFI